jgi:hypothetical protein
MSPYPSPSPPPHPPPPKTFKTLWIATTTTTKTLQNSMKRHSSSSVPELLNSWLYTVYTRT